MRYDLRDFAHLCKRGKMGCFERLILAVCCLLMAVGYWPLARCIVMLKFAAKREQSQACLSYAEREQIEQS